MKIGIEHHNDQFNVTLASKEGAQPFLTIKGCRVVEGSKGPFVSFPAKKMESGKYWNHVYASDAFQAAVVEAFNASKPKEQPARQKDERWQASAPARAVEDDVPW